jgi:transposase-like protein
VLKWRLNRTLRKTTKNKRFFPSDAAAFTQWYLPLQRIMKQGTLPIRNWPEAMNRFSIEFAERMPVR